ncbi:MAG TPA: STAS domain-containing protein [Gammaproteobacteria bacterium]|nr:STAS domain-containing protein [Gammaproteobacteria bacterium]
MAITSNLSNDGTLLTISVQGRFDFAALQNFRSAYEKVLPKPNKYIIDLKESEYLDSSALGMLLALRDYSGGDNADISVINCNPDVKKILVITKLDELFSVS